MKIQYLQTFAKNLHDFAKKKKQLDNIVSKNIWNPLFFLPGGSQNAPIGPDPKKCSLLYFGKSSISFKKSFRALRFVSDSTKISKNRPGMAREITQRRPNVDRTCSVRVGLLFLTSAPAGSAQTSCLLSYMYQRAVFVGRAWMPDTTHEKRRTSCDLNLFISKCLPSCQRWKSKIAEHTFEFMHSSHRRWPYYECNSSFGATRFPKRKGAP